MEEKTYDIVDSVETLEKAIESQRGAKDFLDLHSGTG